MPVHLDEIDIPRPWQQALDRLISRPGTTMILGAMDVGKSTLARLTVHAFQQLGLTVAWIDCDVGQSDIGPPGTIALAIVQPPLDLDGKVRADAMRFVGSVSPSGHLLPVVVATQRMVQLARKRRVKAIVINTTGMVHGVAARTLKQTLIDVVTPDTILALQEDDEIEHLLGPIERQGRCRIDRLPLSNRVRGRSRETRRQARQAQYRTYFESAENLTFGFSQLSLQGIFLGSGVRLSENELADASCTLDAPVLYGESCGDGVYLVVEPDDPRTNLTLLPQVFGVEHVSVVQLSDFQDRLVGLCEATTDLLALGSLQHLDWVNETLHILTPLAIRSKNRIKVVQFGSMRVDRTGQESSLQ